MIRIVIADDQELFTHNLKIVLETRAPDMKVVAVAHDGIAAVEYAVQLKPDVVLMDVRMPKLDGVRAVHTLRDKPVRPRIIMLTTFDDDEYVHDALTYGAVGYILKDISPDLLISSIRAVMDGTVSISPAVAAKLVQQASAKIIDPVEKRLAEQYDLEELSKREHEVLRLLAEGMLNPQIADELSIAEQTVKNYVSSIYFKLGLHDRTELWKKDRSPT